MEIPSSASLLGGGGASQQVPLGEPVSMRDILHQGCIISGAVLQVGLLGLGVQLLLFGNSMIGTALWVLNHVPSLDSLA